MPARRGQTAPAQRLVIRWIDAQMRLTACGGGDAGARQDDNSPRLAIPDEAGDRLQVARLEGSGRRAFVYEAGILVAHLPVSLVRSRPALALVAVLVFATYGGGSK